MEQRVRAALPSPTPSPEKLDVEGWVAEFFEEWLPKAWVKNSQDEEVFYDSLEELPKRIVFDFILDFAKRYPLPEELERRLVDALPGYIEHWRSLWLENFPSREKRRRWVEEMERFYPRVKTRENGYAWWFNAQEKFARLKEKYRGFDEQWSLLYPLYEEYRRPPTVEIPDELRREFLKVCFSRNTIETTLMELSGFQRFLEEVEAERN